VITRRYDLRVSCRSLKVVFILPGLLCVLVAAAGCSTSGSKPSASATRSSAPTGAPTGVPAAVPTTTGQLNTRLATTADYPDGIRADVLTADPGGDHHVAPGPSFATATCFYLQTPVTAFSYGVQPELSGASSLDKKLATVITDPTTQVWIGAEVLDVYRTDDGAVQAMNGVAQLAARCSKAPQAQDTAGLQSTDRERLVPMTGLGNQAFEVEFSTVSPNVPVAASNWVVIRSGRILLTVYEQAISGSVEKYLQAATQAAWRVFSHSS
jgi:hypothetical protein